MKLLLILCLIFSNHLFAQSRNIDKEFEEIMKRRDEIFRSLFNDDVYKEFDQQMEKMLEEFTKAGLNFDRRMFKGGVAGEYDWVETETHKILKLKVTQIKDKPLDIKIEKGMIRVKGEVEEVLEVNPEASKSSNQKKKSVSRIHFENAFSLPNDVDQRNAEFENKEGELLIKFKKLKKTKPLKNESITIPSSPKSNEERVPLPKDDAEMI